MALGKWSIYMNMKKMTLGAAPFSEQPHIDHYELLNTVSQGTFAKVRLTRHILIRTEVTVKVIHWWGSSKLF